MDKPHGEGLAKIRLSRSSRLVQDPSWMRVLIIGAGSIGSNAAHLLASMGVVSIAVIDDDIVGEENVFPAFFSQENVGVAKTVALSADLFARTGVVIRGIVDRYPSDNTLLDEKFDVVIIGTDTKQSRKDARFTISDILNEDGVWIDGRMGGTEFSVTSFRASDRARYREYRDMLDGGGEAQLPCGEKATAPITKGFLNGAVGMVISAYANDKPIPVFQGFDMRTGIYLFVEEEGE